jgi:hypothetical protein
MSTELLLIDEITQSDNDKFITHNTANRQIEGQRTRIITRTNGGPPISPSAGDTYMVDVTNSSWVTAAIGDLAHFYGGQWFFYTPAEGIQRVWVNDEDVAITFDGTAWVNESGVSLGITVETGGGLIFNTSLTQTSTIEPTVLGTLLDSTNLNVPVDIFVRGDYAYIVSQTGDSLTIIDISDPMLPILEGVLIDGTNLNGAHGVAVAGDYAYIACNTGNSVTVINISDRTTPVFTGIIVDGTNLNGASDIQVVGTYGYVTATTGDRLTIIDLSIVESPLVIGSVTDGTNLNGPIGLDIDGNFCYVACNTGDSLTIVDITSVTTPTITGQLIDATNLNGCNSVTIQGKYAYTACGDNDSMSVVDISDPTTPIFAGSVVDGTKLNGAFGVAIAGHYAYLTNEAADSVSVIDISDPTTPVEVNTLTDVTNLNGAYGIFLSGNYLYITAKDGDRITVININGARLLSADIGNIKTHHIEVNQEAQVGALTSKGAIFAGGGIKTQGDISLSGTLDRMFRATSTTSCYFDLNSATAKNAGFRLFKDKIFKWQIYNDGDGSDKLSIENSSGVIILDMTQAGALKLKDGTDALPPYTFIDEPNKGMYSAGVNTIGLSTDSVQRMKVDNNGVSVTSGILTIDNGQLFAPGHNTTASAANAHLDSGTGELKRSTSSRRFKRDIVAADKKWLKSILNATEVVTYRSAIKGDDHSLQLGLIAEDTHPLLVCYDSDGKPNGVQYERVALLAISELQDTNKRLDKLEVLVEKLLFDKE